MRAGRTNAGLIAAICLVLVPVPVAATGAPSAPTAAAPGSWSRQSPQPTGQRLNAVDMASATQAWAVGEHGAIVHTEDGGATWREQRGGTTEPLNAVRFIDSLHGLAMGNVSLYTTDGGLTWRRGSGAPGTVYGVEMADTQRGFATVGADFIYRTVDGGASWTRQSMPVVIGRVQFFDPLNGVASGAGVLRTTDGGATWTRVPGATGAPFFINFDEGWAVSGDSAKHTSNGGVSYTTQTVPPGTWANDEHFVDAQHGWAVGAESNIIATTDGGATWATQRGGQGSAIANRYPLNAVDFADASWGVAVGNCGTILSTSNGGGSWRQRLSGSCTLTSDIAAADANHLWAAQTDGEVLRTVDGGRHWQRVILPTANLNGGYLGAIDFVDNLNGWVVSSAGTVGDQFVFHTTDGGRTWQQQGPTGDPANLFGIDSVDGRTVVAVGYVCCVGPQITRSTDSGATWTVLPNQLTSYGGRFRAVQFATVSTGWIAGDDGALLKTTNGGATWKQQNPIGLYRSGATYLDVSFVDERTGWIAVSGPSLDSYLLRTTDGGRTWQKQPLPVQSVTRVVAAGNGVIWVGGLGTVARSGDAGATWTVERPAADAAYDGIAVAGTAVWVGGTDFTEGTGGIWRRPQTS